MRILSFLAFFISFNVFSQTLIFNETFQSSLIPSNFTLIDNDLNSPAVKVSEYNQPWIIVPDPENISDSIAASTSYFTEPAKANVWMITPPLNLGDFGNYISWNAKSHDPSSPDDYLVLVSTTNKELSSFKDTIGYVEEENFEWTKREVNLSAKGFNSQIIYIAFVNVTFDGFKLYIDDIEVRKDDPTSINEFEKSTIRIYPNPFTDLINIQSEKVIDSIEIKDLNGKTLLETTNNSINLSFLQNGYYFIVLNSEKHSLTQKILKN